MITTNAAHASILRSMDFHQLSPLTRRFRPSKHQYFCLLGKLANSVRNQYPLASNSRKQWAWFDVPEQSTAYIFVDGLWVHEPFSILWASWLPASFCLGFWYSSLNVRFRINAAWLHNTTIAASIGWSELHEHDYVPRVMTKLLWGWKSAAKTILFIAAYPAITFGNLESHELPSPNTNHKHRHRTHHAASWTSADRCYLTC